jgi:hypothetical protein
MSRVYAAVPVRGAAGLSGVVRASLPSERFVSGERTLSAVLRFAPPPW